MTRRGEWVAEIRLARPSRASAERLYRTLVPEAEREVPRATATLTRPKTPELLLRVRARETGAARAALNTYLGWLQLALKTEEVASAEAPGPKA